jgi:hypothetical protein
VAFEKTRSFVARYFLGSSLSLALARTSALAGWLDVCSSSAIHNSCKEFCCFFFDCTWRESAAKYWVLSKGVEHCSKRQQIVSGSEVC